MFIKLLPRCTCFHCCRLNDVCLIIMKNLVTKCPTQLLSFAFFCFTYCTKKSFPWTIFPVSVTKSAVSCGFGHIYRRNPLWKTFLDQSWFSACRYISIKATNWWCGFRWVWSGMLKEAIKILRSQKPKKVWSLFCACIFLFIKVINWLCKFRWVWSGMRKEVFKTLIS